MFRRRPQRKQARQEPIIYAIGSRACPGGRSEGRPGKSPSSTPEGATHVPAAAAKAGPARAHHLRHREQRMSRRPQRRQARQEPIIYAIGSRACSGGSEGRPGKSPSSTPEGAEHVPAAAAKAGPARAHHLRLREQRMFRGAQRKQARQEPIIYA